MAESGILSGSTTERMGCRDLFRSEDPFPPIDYIVNYCEHHSVVICSLMMLLSVVGCLYDSGPVGSCYTAVRHTLTMHKALSHILSTSKVKKKRINTSSDVDTVHDTHPESLIALSDPAGFRT